jgi:hypothetical protein
MNMLVKNKKNAETSTAPADPPKVNQKKGMPPPPEEIPQMDIRPKKGKDANSGGLGGIMGSVMGGNAQQDDDMEEGLLDKKANNNDKKGGNNKTLYILIFLLWQ